MRRLLGSGSDMLLAVGVLYLSAGAVLAADVAAPKPKAATVSFVDIGTVEFETPPAAVTIRYTLDGSAPTAQSFAYCTPLQIAGTLTLKAAAFDAAGAASSVIEVACIKQDGGQKTPPPPTVAINLDFSEAPDLKDWALRAQKDAAAYYPVMVEKLSGEGFVPPRQVTFHFKKSTEGIAHARGNTITFMDAWIRKHPDDTGTVIHELAHVIQSYKGKGPHWLVEGIADYIRWCNWEPKEKYPKVDPKRAKYTNGYRDSAAFLAWIEKTHDKDLIKKLNHAIRTDRYGDSLFNEYTGRDIDALWAEFVATLAK